MSDAALRDRLVSLRAAASKRVAALPDGGVDHCYRVTGTGGVADRA